VTAGVFGVGHDDSDVIRFSQRICRAADCEELVPADDRVAAVTDIFRRLIGSVQQSESHLAGFASQLPSYHRIDDAPNVHGSSHIAVAASAGDVEQTHSFHEERSLFGIKNREALIDLNLERVAFYLAEVRVDRGVKGDIRGDAVLGAQSEVLLLIDRFPLIRGRLAYLAYPVRNAW